MPLLGQFVLGATIIFAGIGCACGIFLVIMLVFIVFAFVVGLVCLVTINIYSVVVAFCVGVVSRVIIVVGSIVFFVAVVACGSDVIGAVAVIILGDGH